MPHDEHDEVVVVPQDPPQKIPARSPKKDGQGLKLKLPLVFGLVALGIVGWYGWQHFSQRSADKPEAPVATATTHVTADTDACAGLLRDWYDTSFLPWKEAVDRKTDVFDHRSGPRVVATNKVPTWLNVFVLILGTIAVGNTFAVVGLLRKKA